MTKKLRARSWRRRLAAGFVTTGPILRAILLNTALPALFVLVLILATREYEVTSAAAPDITDSVTGIELLSSSTVAIAAQQAEYVKALPIRITRLGFEAKDIRLSSGRFMLAVDTTIGDVNLRFDRVGGNTLRQVLLSRNKRRLRETHDLAPGEYVLREENHPDWICKITIAP